MLQSLSIRNVVLIDKLDLEFHSGLSVLTGETGAGKSILLDSLGLVTGSRAEVALIRHGEDKLSVTASFNIDSSQRQLLDLLHEYDIDCSGELIIKRSLNRDGKGKIFINDQPVTAKFLKEVGRYLVEVHGQFDNQGLLNPAGHREVLDSYGGYSRLLLKVRQTYGDFCTARRHRREAEENLEQAKIEEDSLRHWVGELQKLSPAAGEEEELSKRRLELMNSEKIIESLSYAYGVLSNGVDVADALRRAQSAVSKADGMTGGKYAEIIDSLEQAQVNASEALNRIEEASANISLDTGELENIETRLFALRDAARKHQVGINDLPQVLEDLKKKLAGIESGEEGLDDLRRREETTRLEYVAAAGELSSARKLAALKLDRCVMSELPPLKMEKARFVTMVIPKDENGWSENGFDDVSFTVATNPNSPQGPINKIASGGELARFMLALKVNLAETSQVATMIFDEVDAGVGGATAQAVGERLARLADKVQVLVVTHSPQVASRADNHYKVSKSTIDNITTTKVSELGNEEQCEEIARMLAGEVITDEARAAARVLIKAG